MNMQLIAPPKSMDAAVFKCHHCPPRLDKELERFDYSQLLDEVVVCDLEYTPAERGSRSRYGEQMEPDYDASAELVHVWCGSADIYSLLTDMQRRDIEEAFLAQEPEYDGCDEPDFAADETSFG